MCLGTCLLHNIAISFVSEYDHHPSVRHVSTHQGISLGRKSVHVHRSETHFMEQVVLYLHICKLSLINCSRIQAGGVAQFMGEPKNFLIKWFWLSKFAGWKGGNNDFGIRVRTVDSIILLGLLMNRDMRNSIFCELYIAQCSSICYLISSAQFRSLMKSYVRSIPFSENYDMIWNLSALRVVAFAQRAQKDEKTIATLWISSMYQFFLVFTIQKPKPLSSEHQLY